MSAIAEFLVIHVSGQSHRPVEEQTTTFHLLMLRKDCKYIFEGQSNKNWATPGSTVAYDPTGSDKAQSVQSINAYV